MTNAELQPSRSGTVEGRDVLVFDGLLAAADLAQYVEALDRSPFTRTEVARSDTSDYRHWVSELPLANVTQLPLWAITEQALAVARPGERYQPYRAYTNYAAYGDMLYAHCDCGPDQRELTALWFMSREWEAGMGAGRTLFFDRSGDALFCVSPRPGRLVLFDGAIPHAGRPPSRICYTPRYTFAIKLAATPAS